ncbi:MAG: hypothetical protein K9G49_04950 [Taibaiella sp.]|nr:hypothetical protein [Taibaiella sp.]
MKNLFMYTCKEATYLISKKEEGKLTFIQNIKLRLHISMCKFCKLFEKQNKCIIDNIRKLNDTEIKLPAEIKSNISENLKG